MRSAFRSASISSRWGRRWYAKQSWTWRQSWGFPVAMASGGVIISAACLSDGEPAELKEFVAVRGVALVRGLRTLRAASEIALDYKLSLPKKQHDSEEYIAALSACHRSVHSEIESSLFETFRNSCVQEGSRQTARIMPAASRRVYQGRPAPLEHAALHPHRIYRDPIVPLRRRSSEHIV